MSELSSNVISCFGGRNYCSSSRFCLIDAAFHEMPQGKSLSFSGYQIAFVLTGYSVLSFFLAIIAAILSAIFKYIHFLISPDMLELYEEIGKALAPPICLAICLWLYQLFLTYYVFRDREFPDVTITVDNRRFYSIMSYFFFFYNILLGLFSSIMRILKGMLLGVIFISRIDRTSLMQGFQTWDRAFVAYLGFIHVLVAHSHPVMLMFCQLLINSNRDRQCDTVGGEGPGLCVQSSHPEDQRSSVEVILRPVHCGCHACLTRRSTAGSLLSRSFVIPLSSNIVGRVPGRPKDVALLLKMQTVDRRHRSDLDGFFQNISATDK